MDFISILGFIATLCTTAAFLPHTIKLIRTRHTRGLSAITYSMIVVGSSLWIYYAFLRADWPVFIANSVQGFLSFIILILKIINIVKLGERW